MMWRLTMLRGRRQVLIGLFPSSYRAKWAADALEWDGSWKPVITATLVTHDEE